MKKTWIKGVLNCLVVLTILTSCKTIIYVPVEVELPVKPSNPIVKQDIEELYKKLQNDLEMLELLEKIVIEYNKSLKNWSIFYDLIKKRLTVVTDAE